MKNKYEIRGDVTAIRLESKTYGSMETLISTSQLERIEVFPYRWGVYWDKSSRTYYVHGQITDENGNKKRIMLHRLLTNAPKGMQVDHINHSGLDNTDENLRVVTQAENKQNQKGAQQNSKSGVRGVCWRKREKKWIAKIKLNKKTIHLGYFSDINEAEKVVKEARAQYMPYSQESLQIENPNIKRFRTTQTELSDRSRSGHRNVYWKSSRKQWIVAFFINKANKEFGWFEDLDDAIMRAKEVREQLSKQKSS